MLLGVVLASGCVLEAPALIGRTIEHQWNCGRRVLAEVGECPLS